MCLNNEMISCEFRPMSVCPQCGHESEGNFCPECGVNKAEAAAAAGPKFCGNCGTELQEGTKFCSSCGTPTSQSASPDSGQVPTAVAPVQPAASPLAPDEYIIYQLGTKVGGLIPKSWKVEYDIIGVPDGQVVLMLRENEAGGLTKIARFTRASGSSSYDIGFQSAGGQSLGRTKGGGKLLEIFDGNGTQMGSSSISMAGLPKNVSKANGEAWFDVEKDGMTIMEWKHKVTNSQGEVASFDRIDSDEAAQILGTQRGVLNNYASTGSIAKTMIAGCAVFHLKFVQPSLPESTKLAVFSVVYQASHIQGQG